MFLRDAKRVKGGEARVSHDREEWGKVTPTVGYPPVKAKREQEL
jgi:hypothetical protein